MEENVKDIKKEEKKRKKEEKKRLKEEKKQNKKPVDKMKIAKIITAVFLIIFMCFSVFGTLLYYLLQG